MIKINLLPPEKRKKAQKKKTTKTKEKEKKVSTGPSLSINEKVPIIVGLVVTLLALGVAAYIFFSMNNKIDSLNAEKKANTTLIADLDNKLKQIKNLTQQISELEQREKLIAKLREDQSLPIRVLDELSDKLPDTVWLESLIISGKKITIDGSGLTYSDVVEFVNALKNSKLYKNVDLNNAKIKKYNNQDVSGFRITMEING
jgi:Tfp pilus assembly protein PilN